MIPLMLLLAQPLPASGPSPAEARMARMTAIYDEVCLQAFPDDARLDAAMRRHGATPLTPEQVRITLNDDPGRGWHLAGEDGDSLVFLELPPYHACSVRWPTTDPVPDTSGYRRVADAFEASRPGFATMPPFDRPVGNIQVHAVGEQRQAAGGGGESLFVIAQRVAGTPGVEVRFVHQQAEPGAH